MKEIDPYSTLLVLGAFAVVCVAFAVGIAFEAWMRRKRMKRYWKSEPK